MPRSLSNPTVPNAPKPAVKQKDRDPVAAGKRDAAFNRSASFNYFLSDKFEAGVALRGTEVKSIREGKANLKDAYGLLKDGECFLLNAHIGPFSHGNAMNHDSLRTRKLLLHKAEVRKLEGMPHTRRASPSSPCASTSATAASNASSPSPKANRSGTSAPPNASAKPTTKPKPP